MTQARSLGMVIRDRRRDLGLTQEQLAQRIGGGVRQAEVSRLESDRVTLPRRARLERIAAALELPIGELLASAGWSGADAAFARREPVSSLPERPLVSAGAADSSQTLVAIDPLALVRRLRVAIAEAEQTSAESKTIRASIAAIHRDRAQKSVDTPSGRLQRTRTANAPTTSVGDEETDRDAKGSGFVSERVNGDDTRPNMFRMVADADHGEMTELILSADD
jgi:transcriptional regulator with XRE-family HTH domain